MGQHEWDSIFMVTMISRKIRGGYRIMFTLQTLRPHLSHFPFASQGWRNRWAGFGGCAQDFGSSVNPISNHGGLIMPTILILPTLFSDLLLSLLQYCGKMNYIGNYNDVRLYVLSISLLLQYRLQPASVCTVKNEIQ